MKKEVIYAFIDSQNLNLGTSKDLYKGSHKIYEGWKLDFKKFRVYLSHKLRVTKAFIFIGFIAGQERLYNNLKSYGYTLVYKPTIQHPDGVVKGNIDTDLVLHASVIEYQNYDKAVVVSGDGDFCCLHDYLVQKNKLASIVIPNKKSESVLLKKFQKYKLFLEYEKNKLEFKP